MYPIGNDPCWPLKCVYSEPGTQNCWEINGANAVVWAVAIVRPYMLHVIHNTDMCIRLRNVQTKINLL